MSEQLRLLPAIKKEELKKQVAIIAKRWPPYDKRYNEEGFFADIDNGKITSEEDISAQFQQARMLML